MKAFAIQRPDTAFSLSPGKRKRPRERNDAHLKWIASLPCLVCGNRPCHAAHLRGAYPAFGKRETGMSEKANDAWTVPLCPRDHTDGPEAQHKGSEEAFWLKHQINPFLVALALYQASGDDEAAELILKSARRT